jgi:hypothetical protein
MKNVKLFEEFNSNTLPKASQLKEECLNFLGLTDEFKKRNWRGSKFYLDKGVEYRKFLDFIDFLLDKGYSITTYPEKLGKDTKSAKVLYKMNMTIPDNGGYSPVVIIDCLDDNGTKTKYYFSPDGDSSINFGSLRPYDILETPVFTSNDIECLFWDGDDFVEGKFEHTETDQDYEIISMFYESYETSNSKVYSMTVSGSGSEYEGYQPEDIEDIYLN